MGLLIRGGRVIDPATGVDREADVLLAEGRIAAIDASISPGGRHRVIDARNLLVAPGLVDMHVHLRDPGQTHKEDIASGTAAAVHGGFTAVACMPNTIPPIDHPTVVEYIQRRATSTGACRVLPIATITKGRLGEELAPIPTLAASGAVALSDDGDAVKDAGLLRRAMSYARQVGLPVIEHSEDATLSNGGAMHEGMWSVVLGLRGIPSVSEEAIVARDIVLAEDTGARLHVAHVSTAGSVALIREAKRRGVGVTAEVTPHHLLLTDEAVGGYNTDAKMNPPLRGQADRAALVEGLLDGTIDAIATDHAPHTPEEKRVEFDSAPFGVVGLETALSVLLTRLVRPGLLSLMEVLRRLSTTPAAILGLAGGRLELDAPADLVLIDLDRRWTVDPAVFASKSRNTPFAGWELQGKAVMTIVGGEIKYSELVVEAHA
ncbi:MAG TPA: dihydroorotase [bacterium]|nr:dihydroorotase [bacterium]